MVPSPSPGWTSRKRARRGSFTFLGLNLYREDAENSRRVGCSGSGVERHSHQRYGRWRATSPAWCASAWWLCRGWMWDCADTEKCPSTQHNWSMRFWLRRGCAWCILVEKMTGILLLSSCLYLWALQACVFYLPRQLYKDSGFCGTQHWASSGMNTILS